MTTESDVFPAFQHEGLELLYMLEGEVAVYLETMPDDEAPQVASAEHDAPLEVSEID